MSLTMDVVGKFEKAKKIMDECENSQLVLERRKLHIKLAPRFIGNMRAGVHQQLTDKLLHRDVMLDGFPLACTNVRALQKFGKIISDHTCVHFDVEADFIIFKPAVGQKLNAKVNKIGKRHIGCLVHEHFNAWAPHMSSTEKMVADLLMGAEIEITVQEISTNRNIVSIKGKFERFLSEELEKNSALSIKPVSKNEKRKRKQKDTNEVADTEETIYEDNESLTTEKNNIHTKVAEMSQDNLSITMEGEVNLTVNGEVEEESPRKSKKKHKKEKKKKKEIDEDIDLVNGTTDINDSIASLTSCEPLFTSTQVEDINNNEGGKKKSKKHKKKHKVSSDTIDSLLQNDSILSTPKCSINDNVDTDSKHGTEHKHKKSRKRTHVESNFTSIKVFEQGQNLSEPSPIKKLKKKVIDSEVNMDSSADFEDASVSKKKKKKKKNKDKRNENFI